MSIFAVNYRKNENEQKEGKIVPLLIKQSIEYPKM